MLVPVEEFKQQRQKIASLWQKPKPEVPNILVPKDQGLLKTGYRRPTWLALIFLFFSPRFVNRVMYLSLWPISPLIPEYLHPWTLVLCTTSPFLFAF